MITHEELGRRVDHLGERMNVFDERLRNVEENMATKGDIQTVLTAISQMKTEIAGPVEVYSTTRSMGKFIGWASIIVAGVFGAIVAVRDWWMR